MTAHHFAFSTNWRDGERLCRDCRYTYADGDHIEINTLQPRTHYVCPTGGGMGHSSIYTGDSHLHPELRTPTEHLCMCGAEFVIEDTETWRLSWEMQEPPGTPWHKVAVIQSRHATELQRQGLLALAMEGELIRSVEITQLVEVIP